jgi:carboxymethylenebutenolidase
MPLASLFELLLIPSLRSLLGENDTHFVLCQLLQSAKGDPNLVGCVFHEDWSIANEQDVIVEEMTFLAIVNFVVAVPDLYHGKIATEPDDAKKMVMMLRGNLDKAAQEIIGALETVKAMPNVEPKKLGLMGFCVGGFLTYFVASRYPDLGAVVPFYGGGYDPTPEDVAKVNAPVLAVYGKRDHSISMEQIEKIERVYKEAGKDITVKIYDADHAFINPDHGPRNEEAAKEAWSLAVDFLKRQLK